MQRAFHCLAPRVQCHALHPRKTHRPSVRSWGEAAERRKREKGSGRASLLSRNGIRYERLPATPEDPRIRTLWNVIPAAIRGGRASSRLIERTEERDPGDMPLLLRYAVAVTTCADATMKRTEPSFPPRPRQWRTGGVNDGIARRRRRGRSRAPELARRKRSAPATATLSALPANIFSAYAHSAGDIWSR